MLTVEGIDVFFIGPGDLSHDMGYPPAPAFGEPRPDVVIDKVAIAVKKIAQRERSPAHLQRWRKSRAGGPVECSSFTCTPIRFYAAALRR